jgi:hypothetical protein
MTMSRFCTRRVPRLRRDGLVGLIAVLPLACGGASTATRTSRTGGPSQTTASAAVVPASVRLATFHGPGFSVGLPSRPKTITFTVQLGHQALKIHFYLVADAGSRTVYEVATMPGGLLAHPALVSVLLRALAGVSGGTVTHTGTRYLGFPAIDARVVIPGPRQVTLFARLVSAPKLTVMLAYAAPHDGTVPPPGYTAFVSSLHIP